MYSDNGSFANSFSRFGITFYLKGNLEIMHITKVQDKTTGL